MSKGRWRQFDWGLGVVLAIGFIAVWPFVSRADLPQATDAELHIFRLAELSRLVRDGAFYPRWAPNFYYGYGYPIFNYYAPLSYYSGLLVDFMPVLDAVTGVKAVFVAGLLLGGLGTYGYTSGRWGRPAGYVAAALFLYAPYVQYVDPHARGDLAEAYSFAFFPLALWALDAFVRQGRAHQWVLGTLAVAAIILSHNLMAMVFFGLLAAWWLWQLLVAREAGSRRAAWFAGLALLLGVGLAAFFWLPVALEQNAVNLSTLVGEGSSDNFDFRNHFVDLGTLLSGSLRLDWGATEPEFTFNLGQIQWLLALLGVALAIWGRIRRRSQALFFVVAGGVLCLLMLSPSRFVWETVPLLPFLQFPWRLLGPASIVLAILGGAGVAAVLELPALQRRPHWQPLLPAAAVAAALVLGLPLSQVPPWPADFGSTSALGTLEVELQGRWLGTTSTSDFVPVTVAVIPRAAPAMVEAYRSGGPIDRVNRATLPPGTTVQFVEEGPLHWRYLVDGSEPFALRLFLFDFPGWQVTVDGAAIPTELGLPEGFLVAPLPAGAHTVDVFFADTAPRRTAWGISLLALLLLILGAAVWRDRAPSTGVSAAPGRWTRADGWVLGAAVGVSLLLVGMLEPAGVLHSESTGRIAIPAEVNIWADFGGQVGLIGYDLSATTLAPGDELDAILYWKAEQPLDINYQVFVHLLGPDGALVAQSDKLNPGEFPTRRWPLDKYVRDQHQLRLPEDAPPGDYRLTAGLWVKAEGWRLPLWNDEGRPVGDSYPLATLTVEE